MIERGGIVYVGLDALSDPDVASAVGNAMFADLTSVAGSLYKDAQRGAPLKKSASTRMSSMSWWAGSSFRWPTKPAVPASS